MASQSARPRKADEPCWDGIDTTVRAACEQRWAELEARAADPEVQARLEASRLAAQAAPPPWERDDWVSRPSVPGEPGLNDPPTPEEIERVKARIAQTPRYTRTVKVKDLLGKIPKTQEQKDMAKLREARNKVRKLGDVVRSNMFNDWLDRCVVKAEDRRQWTRSTELYASYVSHARQYGPSLKDGEKATVTDRMVAREEMATLTAWGKMMGSLFPNKERRSRPNGWHYPVRLKRDA